MNKVQEYKVFELGDQKGSGQLAVNILPLDL